MPVRKIHGKNKFLDPAVNAGESLELDATGHMVTYDRVPTSLPLQSDDGTGAIGSSGTIGAPFAMWDHKHPLPAVFTGATGIDGEAGIVPKPLSAERSYFLNAEFGWIDANIPTASDIAGLAPVAGGATGSAVGEYALKDHKHDLEPLFTGAGVGSNGTRGSVPAPVAGQNDEYLRGSGGWAPIKFTEASDTPSSYSGKGGYVVAVNSGATALEFVSGVPAETINIDISGSTGIGDLGTAYNFGTLPTGVTDYTGSPPFQRVTESEITVSEEGKYLVLGMLSCYVDTTDTSDKITIATRVSSRPSNLTNRDPGPAYELLSDQAANNDDDERSTATIYQQVLIVGNSLNTWSAVSNNKIYNVPICHELDISSFKSATGSPTSVKVGFDLWVGDHVSGEPFNLVGTLASAYPNSVYVVSTCSLNLIKIS
jgi:hypothetical protein